MVSESLGFTNFTHIENEISRDGEYKHNQRFCLISFHFSLQSIYFWD